MRRQSKMIHVRVRDDDTANILERQTPCLELITQRDDCLFRFCAGINERELVTFGKVAIDGTDRERGRNRDGV